MGDDNNIFGLGDNSLLNRFVGILERQTDDKLTPNQLMGFLSLFNMLSILNLVHGADAGIRDVSALDKLTSLAGQAARTPEGSALKDTLMGLLGGQNQSGPDIGGLLNMVGGGNKKINPQMLLTLLNLLNSQMGAKSDHGSKAEHAKIEEGSRDQAGEVSKEKDRGVELKYDKKKTI